MTVLRDPSAICTPFLYTFVYMFATFYVCRYSREEPFTALNVDVRHHDNLYESLDAFVKGDLLEGANAYHCEKCDKKVGAISFFFRF